MKTARDRKTGRYAIDWSEEELELVEGWKKAGVPKWKMVNDLVEMRNGGIHHMTAYRLLDRLEAT